MKRVLGRHLLRIAPVAMLAAMLPSALYIGHWPVFQPPIEQADSGGHAHHAEAAAAANETEDAHAAAGHCSAGPSRCTEAPAPNAQPILFTDSGLALAFFGALLLLAVDLRYFPVNPFVQRLIRPPRRTFAVFAS
jgi:hypothetical protein